MDDYLWPTVAVVLVVAFIRPIFWLLSLSISLWLGRKFMSEETGKVWFGHYWKSAVSEQPEQAQVDSRGERERG